MARAMAADRDWVRWTVDPATGQLLDRGADSYRPSDKLRAFVADRDRVCGFPGCNRPAEQCDCDHMRHLRPPRPDHPRQPRTPLPATPQRQNPRPVETQLRPRHRHQDLDQPTRQDLHQEHRPTTDLSRPVRAALPVNLNSEHHGGKVPSGHQAHQQALGLEREEPCRRRDRCPLDRCRGGSRCSRHGRWDRGRVRLGRRPLLRSISITRARLVDPADDAARIAFQVGGQLTGASCVRRWCPRSPAG